MFKFLEKYALREIIDKNKSVKTVCSIPEMTHSFQWQIEPTYSDEFKIKNRGGSLAWSNYSSYSGIRK